MSALKDALKNEHAKQVLRATGVRKVGLQQRETPHYRRPLLEDAGGWMKLGKYEGPAIDSEFLWHGGHHDSDHMRYAVIASVESGPALERWIESQRLSRRVVGAAG